MDDDFDPASIYLSGQTQESQYPRTPDGVVEGNSDNWRQLPREMRGEGESLAGQTEESPYPERRDPNDPFEEGISDREFRRRMVRIYEPASRGRAAVVRRGDMSRIEPGTPDWQDLQNWNRYGRGQSPQSAHVMETIQGGRRQHLAFPYPGSAPVPVQRAAAPTLQEVQLSSAERNEVARLQAGLSEADDEFNQGIVPADVARERHARIHARLDPLLQRDGQATQMAHQQQIQMQAQAAMHTSALQEHIRDTNNQSRAQRFGQHVGTFTNPQTGEVFHAMPTHNGGWEPVPWQRQAVPGEEPWMNTPQGVSQMINRRYLERMQGMPATPANVARARQQAIQEVTAQVNHVQTMRSQQAGREDQQAQRREQAVQHEQERQEKTRDAIVHQETQAVDREIATASRPVAAGAQRQPMPHWMRAQIHSTDNIHEVAPGVLGGVREREIQRRVQHRLEQLRPEREESEGASQGQAAPTSAPVTQQRSEFENLMRRLLVAPPAPGVQPAQIPQGGLPAQRGGPVEQTPPGTQSAADMPM